MRVVWLAAQLVFFIAIGALAVYFSAVRDGYPRDLDGNYAKQNPELHAWFDHLASGRGLCCSFADGQSLEDVDWNNDNGHYRVRIAAHSVIGYNNAKVPDTDTWMDVPDNAVVTEPNKFGRAVVWPFLNGDQIQIRCFLPGAGA